MAAEKPVRRDPHSGALLPYAAYDGWRPGEAAYSSWWLVAVCAVIMVAALWGIGR